jgi:8-oxo-dGTP diphosphatase
MPHEIVAALIVRSQKILLGHRSAEREFYPDVWDAFGGHVEPGEGQQQTLVRELQEELGITPTLWKYLEKISFPSDAPDQVTVYLYLVTDWTGTPTNRQLEEHSTIDWFSLEQAVQLPLAHPDYPGIFARYLDADLLHPPGTFPKSERKT